MTRPPAMDALEAGISKVLRDSLAQGGKVIVETSSGIAGTVVDFLTWDTVRPLLRRFVNELGELPAVEHIGPLEPSGDSPLVDLFDAAFLEWAEDEHDTRSFGQLVVDFLTVNPNVTAHIEEGKR